MRSNPFSQIKTFVIITLLAWTCATGVASAQGSSGATLYVAPPTGTYAVGDTFTVSVYINTAGQNINAIESNLTFPADKLQIVSPSVGKSVIEVWVGPPGYSNSAGTVSFRGTIPNPGLNVAQGLISTITFRVKSTGKAIISFSSDSKVLLNDGKGTNVLRDSSGAILDLVLPPPQGPIVVSATNPDQSKWYPSNSAVFSWANDDKVGAYSYVLDSEPVTIPDNIPEPNQDGVSYANVSDGVHYFHIKAYREEVWGGATHFAVRVDKGKPAAFKVHIEPGNKTTNTRPVITFDTTDAVSGLDYYELKVIPLDKPSSPSDEGQGFFVESKSPYIPTLTPGKYQVVVRAYDNAGNVQEQEQRLSILTPIFQFASWITPTSIWGFVFLLALLLASAYISRRYGHWHAEVHQHHSVGATANKDIEKKLARLREYQRKYGHLVLVVALLAFSMFAMGSLPSRVSAASDNLNPPLVLTMPEHVGSDELFYVGGKYALPGALVTVYVQNEQTGETSNFTALTDKTGNWFYAHTDFLPVGTYLVWAQATLGDLSSPPSAQRNMTIDATAISLGGSQISYEFLFGLLSLLLLIATITLALRAAYHYRQASTKHIALTREIQEAEESIRRGFALIKHDIEAELVALSSHRGSRVLKQDEEDRHRVLTQDLQSIEDSIGKEIWDIKNLA